MRRMLRWDGRCNVFEYMDDISEIVYVADVDTYELLYLNDSGRRLFGVEDVTGRTCHAVLQGSSVPCPYCTNAKLRSEENYTWERVNPLTNHRYLLKDRLIDWQGRSARLEVAFDMTASLSGQADMRNALDAESMVLQCARDMDAARDLVVATDSILRRVGTFLSADLVHVFGVRGDRIFGVREWRSVDGPSRLRNLETIDASTLRRWERFFVRGKCVTIDDADDLRESRPVEHELLLGLGIRSVVALSLGEVDETSGFLVVENPSKSLIDPIRSPLQTLCYFYMSTVRRIDNERKLTMLSFHDALTGLYNRNRFMDDVAALEAQGCPIGIVFLDVNDLKLVNDRYGHARGDEALRMCSAKMRSALGEADLYRIGGDEFVALAAGIDEDSFLVMVSELERELKAEERETGLFVSTGAKWSPDSGSVQELLTAADQDMYEKKRSFHVGRAFENTLPDEDAQRAGRESLEDDIVRVRDGAMLREYNMLMSAMGVSVSKHLFTERFEVVWANDYYYAMTGYTRAEYEELFDNCCASYFAGEPEEYARLSEAVVKAYEAGEPGYESLIHMPCKGGERIWIRVVGKFTGESIDGSPVIYATFVNVDDAVQMERERTVTYDNIPGFVARYRIGKDGLRLLYGNVRFAEFFGSVDDDSSAELFRKNIALNDAVIGAHYDALRNGLPVSFDAEAVSTKGERASFRICAECVNRIEGDPVYLVLYLDVTELVEQRHKTELAMARFRELAFVDEVTGRKNRVSFEIEAGETLAGASAGEFAFVAVDVEKFKVINDQFGSERGDAVLRALHETMDSRLEQGECVGRISADVFNLLLRTDASQRLDARIEEMVEAANDAMTHEGLSGYVLTVTAGVYVIDDPALPMIQIRDRANVARKKTGGRRTGLCSCRPYSNEDRVRLANEKRIESRMREALDAGEFVVYLQPKLDLRSGRVDDAEALVRWQDPARGLVPPNDFIPLFDRNGFVVDLDLHVFEQVCKLQRAWADAGMRPITVSVNLSRMHLRDSRFLDRFETIRAAHGVPAAFIEFELTETLVFEDPQLLSSVIDRIHQAGYSCSMDDFGSGYSSLNVLKNLKVDVLKLDRAFFEGFEADDGRGAAIVAVVIELAKRLDMKTVAEGVETEGQRRFLADAGCDMIQGFLFSRPVPPVEFERLAFGCPAGVVGRPKLS